MKQAILAIDQGTTGSTALLIDQQLQVIGRETVDFPQHFPRPGWVEHDPKEIWESVGVAVVRLLQRTGFDPRRIVAVGITNQRETTLLWDRQSGTAPCRGIVWQDRRSTGICTELKKKGLEPLFRERTGLMFDPYFSGTKLTWLLREHAELRAQGGRGELLFGTVDCYLLWRLSGGRVYRTDVSNASRTLMMRLDSCTWDDELLDHLEVPQGMLPEIVSSSEIYGYTEGVGFLPDGIPIAGIAGDQQAALFGQACFAAGESKCTYGTGAFLLANVGREAVVPPEGLLSTVAWQLEGETWYAVEGSTFIAGAAVQWLRDGLGIIRSSGEIEELASGVPDAGGVWFVPALTGLGAPHWRAEARGLLWGMTRGTTKAHLARATLDGIALQVADVLEIMASAGGGINTLRVDGGASQNNLLMQIQADVTGLEVVRPKVVETTALGAAMLAGLAVGFWPDRDSLRGAWQHDRTFSPAAGPAEREATLRGWKEAVRRA